MDTAPVDGWVRLLNSTGLGAKLCCRAVLCPVLLLMGCTPCCALSCSYLWLTIVYNVTYTVALYGLLLFYLVSVCFLARLSSMPSAALMMLRYLVTRGGELLCAS